MNEEKNRTEVTSPVVNSSGNKSNYTSRKRMQRTSYQARMGRKMDNIVRKVNDNAIRLTSSPVDMIRIESKRDEMTHDLISRKITENEIIPVILPTLKSIPIRHMIANNEDIIIPSMYTLQEQQYFELYCPIEINLDIDDLLIRVIFDTEHEDRSYVMCLQIKEELADIGSSSIRLKKYWATLFDEKLPKAVTDVIIESTIKRELLNW